MTIKTTDSKKDNTLLCTEDFKEKDSKYYTNQPKFLFNLNGKN